MEENKEKNEVENTEDIESKENTENIENKENTEVISKDQKKEEKVHKIAHHRGLKNFWWWLFGFGSSLVVIGSTAAICTCVVPVGTYFGNDKNKVSDDVKDKTFLKLALSYKDYSLSDFPVLKSTIQNLIKNAGLDKYITVDYDKLANQITFDFSKIDFNDVYQNCIDIVCTLDSLNLASLLGDFQNLSIMNDSTKVTGPVDTTTPYLYYYYDSNNTLKRAYDDNGNLLEDAKGKDLYYPALRKIPVDEFIKILPTRLGQADVLDILSMVTDVQDDSIFKKLFDGYTLKDMGSFNADSIYISDLIDINVDNRSMFNMLCSAVVLKDGETKPTPETLTLGHLSSINTDKVHLTDIIEQNDSNKELFDILKSASNKDSYDNITLEDVKNLNMKNVSLSSLLKYDDNKRLCDLLKDASNKDSYEKLTIDDLSNFDMDKVSLSSAMPDLSSKLKDILVAGCNKSSFDELKISDLSSFDINNLKLSSVIEDNENNSKLISILVEACGKSSYSDMVVSDLTNGFNIDDVRLITVIGENDNLFSILVDATNKNKDEIKISDLSSFSFDNVKLKTVLKENTGNKILDALLKDDTVTLSNIGSKINSMYLYDIYGEQCFTQDESKTEFKDDHYVKSVNSDGKVVYTIDTDGEYEGDYYLSSSSGLFGLLSFDVTECNSSNGRGDKYVQSDFTYKDLENSQITSTAIENSTIYQLVAAGIISNKEGGYSNNLLKMTFKDVLDTIDSL